MTDTVTLNIEIHTLQTNIYCTEYSGRVYFFLIEEESRTVGYLYTDFVDSDDDPFASLADLKTYLENNIGGTKEFGKITDYRAEYELDLFIYSGFLLNSLPVIFRVKDSLKTQAIGVIDLETDWTNRLSLTYN